MNRLLIIIGFLLAGWSGIVAQTTIEGKVTDGKTGEPILFGTTEEFLRRFSIHSLDDLPSPNPEQVESFKEEAEEEVQLKLDI